MLDRKDETNSQEEFCEQLGNYKIYCTVKF